ncbi:MAG TPA: hypothetical protein VGC53_06860, partial [Vicinamibacteria bacterium]
VSARAFADGSEKALDEEHDVTNFISRRVAISPDGQRFLMLKAVEDSENTAAPPSSRRLELARRIETSGSTDH